MIDRLIAAIQNGDRGLDAQLIARDPALAEGSKSEGLSLVLVARYYGHKEIADMLGETKRALDIFEASAPGEILQVAVLVKTDPNSVNAFGVDGFQPLGLASYFGHLQVVEHLIAHGAQVNSASRNEQQVMPLHSAVAGRWVEITLRLLETGA